MIQETTKNKVGAWVRFIGHSKEQQQWGNCAETIGVLFPGLTYKIQHVKTHSFYTKLFFNGIKSDKGFNSASFEGTRIADPLHTVHLKNKT